MANTNEQLIALLRNSKMTVWVEGKDGKMVKTYPQGKPFESRAK